MKDYEELRIDFHEDRPFQIVLCSDTHGMTKELSALRVTWPDADLFVHCGDSDLREEQMEGFVCVKGNHDYYPNGMIPDHRIIEVLGHRIYVCHGHLDILIYFHFDSLARHAREHGCDIAFFGHMHIYQDFTEGGVRMLNPGSMSHSRDASRRSYMKVTLTKDSVTAERIDLVRDPAKEKREGWLSRMLAKIR